MFATISIAATLSSFFSIACASGTEAAQSVEMSPAAVTDACGGALRSTSPSSAPGVRTDDSLCTRDGAAVRLDDTGGTTTPGELLLPIQEFGSGNTQPTPTPSVTLTADPLTVAPGTKSELTWTGRNVDDCEATLGWTGRRDPSGSEQTPPILQNTQFRLDCDGPFGKADATVTVGTSGGPPPPTLSFTANPTTVDRGSSSTLTWSSQNASACTASGAWSGSTSTSGSESTGALIDSSTFTLTCTGIGGVVSSSVSVIVVGGPLPPAQFGKITIDHDRAAWGKNLADINGDGFLDILEGGGSLGGNVYWYRYPDWQRFQIGSSSGGDDIQAGDIDGDGALDVVVNAAPISWYRNPAGAGGNPQGTWTRYTIATHRSHDIQIADIDRDGKLDVVLRMADPGANPSTRIYLQESASSWTSIPLHNDSNGTGGLALLDVDEDGRIDVIGDGYWLRQPATNITSSSNWLRYNIGAWPAGSSIDTGDINQDGRIDITLAVSEVGVGNIAWFERPANPLTQPWIRHNIDTVEDVHRHHLIDMNNDGELDILFAEMYQSGTDRVGIYYNQGNGAAWVLQVLEVHASHNLATGDIDNDGDIDFVGANWRLNAPADGDLFLWENLVN